MKSALVLLAAVVVLAGCELAPKISIHKAVETGNIDAVKKHLAAGTDVNADAGSLVTPLHVASVFGKEEISELLINNGADVNALMEDTPNAATLVAITKRRPRTQHLGLRRKGRTR